MGFAFFDLDQTLLPYDTQGLFCNFILRRKRLRTAYLAVFAPAAPLAALHLIPTRQIKRLFLTYLWGLPVDRLDAWAREFAQAVVLPAVYPEMREELARHKNDGRCTILNTASPDIYARHIAEALGFDHCVATKIDLHGHSHVPFFPQIDGPNNKHEAKLPAMAHLLPEDALESGAPLPDSYAYSDSSADLPLLRLAEHPVLVNPDAELEKIGLAEGWEVRRPRRPFSGKWSFRAACALQAIGAFS
jgi:HAD superfamily hydrolase (TIGR01490 family)